MFKAFGKDTRGRVRAVGPISRTQYDLSAPARAKVAELKASDGEIKHQVKDLGGKMEILIEGFGSLCHIIKEMKAGNGSYIGSNGLGASPNSPSCSGTPAQSHHGSPAHTDSPAYSASAARGKAIAHTGFDSLSPALSLVDGGIVGAGSSSTPKISLLNMDEEVIAKGTVCVGSLALVAHGSPVSPNHVKVLLDEILLPEEFCSKANRPARTFQDIGVGGFVVHPRSSSRYD